MSSWAIAELIRIFHQVSPAEAQETVRALVERKHPIIWDTGTVRRVLDPTLSKSDQTLLLLYSSSDWSDEKELMASVEYSTLTQFRKRVLEPLHDARILEYDKTLRRVRLTPRGSSDVENRILPKYV